MAGFLKVSSKRAPQIRLSNSFGCLIPLKITTHAEAFGRSATQISKT